MREEEPDPQEVEVSLPLPAPDLAEGRVNRNVAAIVGEELSKGEPVPIPRVRHPKLTDAQARFKIKIRELRMALGHSQTKFGAFLGCPPKNARFTVARWESLKDSTLPSTARTRILRKRFKWLEKTLSEEEFQLDRVEDMDFSK
jgi:hypothetical protein|tara:strand:- start:22230 stop:22661 length:432 start_codon:yes stop_codon:yes gene_type:complete